MAFRTQKISQMTPKGANLEATDLIEVSTIESGSYVTRSITGQEIIDAAVGNVDWGDIGGTLSAQTDLQNALDAKVPTSRTLTINGVTQDLSANRTFTISTGITIGSTAIASGTVGRILFEGAGNVVQESSSLFWDATNARFGVGTSLPSGPLHVVGSATSGFDAILFKGQYSETGYLATSNGAVYFASGAGVTGSFLELSSAVANLRGGTTAVTFTVGSERMRVNNAGNVLIGTTTDAGFKLDVNGTARVQGQLTTSVNQNNPTRISITNTTSGTLAGTEILLNTHSGALMAAGKVSNAYTPYKTLAAGDGYLYNTTFGDISLLNDFATGRIKFAAGGASTAQMTLFSTGNFAINTTTDAGFRLDVNGTARVTGAITGADGSSFNGVIFDGGGTRRIRPILNSIDITDSSGNIGFRVDSSSVRIAQAFSNVDFVRGLNSMVYSQGASQIMTFTLGGQFVNHLTPFADIVASGYAPSAPSGNNTTLRIYTTNTTSGIYGNIILSHNGSVKTGNILIGTSTNIASAIVNVESTTQGFLPPRGTNAQMLAITSPATGLIFFDTTNNKLNCYDGTTWQPCW